MNDIYKITYISLINRYIDENSYINILKKLVLKGFKSYEIENYSRLVMYLYDKKFNDAFNISILLYMKDLKYMELLKVAKMFEDIGHIFSYKKESMIDRIKKINILVNDKIKLLKSFVLTDTVCPNDIKVMNNWIYFTRKEILDRLTLIVEKYITIEQLQFMNIKILHITDIYKMDTHSLTNYYTYFIKHLIDKLNEFIDICKLYIDIEVNYIECCNNINMCLRTVLYLENYEIKIR
jgi:hypothetical protein